MATPHGFRMARRGIERLAPGYAPPRHQHYEAYATVLLRGRFEQSGYAGRMRVAAGDVLVQPTLDCHADRMLSAGRNTPFAGWDFKGRVMCTLRGGRVVYRAAE